MSCRLIDVLQEPVMSLQEISYICQIAASVAVVGSLIYLARQVRQAERNQRAIIQQGRADRTAAGAFALAAPQMASVFSKGKSGKQLTHEEFEQWMMMCRAVLFGAEDSFLQHEAGLLDKSAYESVLAGAQFNLASPGVRASWKLLSGQFGREFREFVDASIERTPVVRDLDAYSEWHRLAQSQSALRTDAS
jgi:hypothetical protein